MSKTKFDEYIAKHYDEVTHATAPALVAKVKELTEKAKVAMPKVYVPKSTTNKMTGHLVGVGPGGDSLLVGHDMMQMMGASKHHMTEEFSAILAHEVGHIKHGDMKTFGGKNIAMSAPILGLVASVGALALVEHHNAKKKKTQETLLPGEEGYTPEVAEKDKNHVLSAVIMTAKYIAAATVGLIAGSYAFKLIHHRMEYRADKYSAELMGSAKPLIKAFEILKSKTAENFESMIGKMHQNSRTPEEIERMRNLTKRVSELTHPAIDKRIDRLRSL